MTDVVQFTSMRHFVADLAAGDPIAIYHEMIEQRMAVGQYGTSRWLLTTIIRATVADPRGRDSHIATLTFAHGPSVEKVYGRLLAAPGEEKVQNENRWNMAKVAYEALMWDLSDALAGAGLRGLPVIDGILHVPADLPLVFAVDEVEAQLAVDYSAGGDGSED